MTLNFKGIRLLLNKRKESYFALYKILGFYPNQLNLYEEALLHKSSSREDGNGRYQNNERLEFLGDAILDAVIADMVFRRFQNKDEGFLTNTRSKIVKRETLNKVALELGLHNLVVSSPRISAQKSHILGNALEAFIGAIYLDKGYDTTRKFIERKIIQPYINIEDLSKKEVNFKSKLLEWSQRFKVNLEFSLLESYTDDNNNPIFQSQALVNNLLAGIGTGYSKKQSQQQAAKMAMKRIKSDKEFVQQILEQSENANTQSNEENDSSIDPVLEKENQ